MKTAQKYLVMNTAMLLGFIISLFFIPRRTPLWLLAVVAAAYAAAYMNYSLHSRLSKATATPSKSYEWSVTIIVILLLLFDIVLGHL